MESVLEWAMLQRHFAASAFALTALVLLAACGGGGSGSTPPGGTPVINPSGTPAALPAATSAPVGPAMAAAVNVSAGGVPVSIDVPASSGGSATLTVDGEGTSNPPSAIPLLARRATSSIATPLAFITITASATVTFTATPSFTLTLPSSVQTNGEQFFIAELTPGATAWTEPFLGPASMSGQTLTFASVNEQVAFQAGQTYAFALYETTPATAASPSPTVSPSPVPQRATTLYVGNSVGGTGNFLVAFSATATGTPAPLDPEVTSGLLQPNFLFVDGTGDLWASQSGNAEVTVYTSALSPLTSKTITCTCFVHPAGIFVGSDGTIYLADNGANAVFVFAPGTSGSATPEKTFTGISSPQGLWLDAGGDIYVGSGSSILIFPSSAAGGTVSPTTTIGNAVGGGTVFGVTIDARGNLWAAGGSDTVTEFAPDATTAERTITNSSVLSGPWGIAVDNAGFVYVGNNTNSDVAVFSPTGGNTPVQVITTDGFNCPMGIAIH
jgi:sugar lactone lactonase YvrE